MRAHKIHRITALIIAFLMFFSSIGFTIDVHYCKGEMKSFSLTGKAESCHGAKNSCTHHTKLKLVEEESDCCSNVTFQVDDLDADFDVAATVELTDIQVKFVSAFIYAFNDISLPKVIKSTFLEIPEPLTQRDIYVLLERFLL